MAEDFRNMKQVTVDGEEYQIFVLPPTRALTLKTRLLKMVGPALGAMLGSADLKDLADKDLNVEAAITTLAGCVDENLFTETVKEFLAKVRHGDGRPLNIDLDFTGRVMTMLRVFWASLEVNYGDFFAVFNDLRASLRQGSTQGPRASAGKSGE